MNAVLVLIVALLVGGAALFLVMRPSRDVPGAGAFDAWGNPNVNRAPPPDAPDDQLGRDIASAIASGLKLANTWFSSSDKAS